MTVEVVSFDRPTDPSRRITSWDDFLDSGRPRAAAWSDAEFRASALQAKPHADATLIYTTGTTGEPKGVLLSASALRASAVATHDRLGGPGQWLLALPTTHVAGLQVLVRSIVAGTEPVRLSGPTTAESFEAAAGRMTYFAVGTST